MYIASQVPVYIIHIAQCDCYASSTCYVFHWCVCIHVAFNDMAQYLSWWWHL